MNDMTTTSTELTENETRKKKQTWMKIPILILAVLLLLFGIRACSGKDASDPGGLALGVIDQGTLDTNADRERLQNALNQQVEAGMVSLFMNTDVKVSDNEADWLIQNVEQNHYSLQINVKDEETDTLIYSSPIVPPGYKVESDTVLETLPAGSHQCLAEFSVIDPETSEHINRIGLKITVTF